MDCLRQASQNKCPHFVVTNVRPDLAKLFLLSMQMGQVMSGELAALDTGGLVGGGVDGNAGGLVVRVDGLAVGVDGRIITSSSDSDMQIVSLRCTASVTTSEMCLCSVRAFAKTASEMQLASLCSIPQSLVRSTTVTSSLSLSAVRSTTPNSLSLWPSEDILSEQEDEGDPVEGDGCLRKSSLKGGQAEK